MSGVGTPGNIVSLGILLAFNISSHSSKEIGSTNDVFSSTKYGLPLSEDSPRTSANQFVTEL